MIVEDDDHIAQLLVFLFQREGFETEYAADGQAAAQMIELNAPPALILLALPLFVKRQRKKLSWLPKRSSKWRWNGWRIPEQAGSRFGIWTGRWVM